MIPMEERNGNKRLMSVLSYCICRRFNVFIFITTMVACGELNFPSSTFFGTVPLAEVK